MDKLPLILFGVGTCAFFITAGALAATQQMIPTLNHMISTKNSAPFVVTGLNWVLAAQCYATLLMYRKMHAYAYAYVNVIGAGIMYVGIAISVITFPLGYTLNYAAIVTIGGIALWMVSCLASLKSWYAEHVTERKMWLHLQTATFVAFAITAAIYMGLRFSLQAELGVFLAELCCGLLIVLFVIQLLHQNRPTEINFTW
jgi:hypothetical protein